MGSGKACDVSKHWQCSVQRPALETDEECVLTSRRGLQGVWTSSARGNPGRQRTCDVWTWERTHVQHLSSCLQRSKLWIMNITEVIGWWDSFITLTNIVSQRWRTELEGQDSHMPASFTLQSRLMNFLTRLRDFWFTFSLHRLTQRAAANEPLSLDVVIWRAQSERRMEAEVCRNLRKKCLKYGKLFAYLFDILVTKHHFQ